jgi:tetratricopeptide (TPR) repeat protein
MKRYISMVPVLLLLATLALNTDAAGQDNLKPPPKYARSVNADTALINSYIRKGLLNLNKKIYNLGKVAAYIDSATVACEKSEYEFPALLHALKAEYFYETGDFTKSETEANLAVRKSEEEKNYFLEALSFVFLGKYYHRTGFFQESINNYNKAIQIAEERKLRGIKPKAHDGKSNVYYAVNDVNERINNLRKMIETALAEKDTLFAEDGLLRLGTLFTEDNRDFRIASTTLRECIRLSLAGKDTAYAAHALANMGWNFYCEKMFDSARYYYQASLKLSVPTKYYGISGNALGNLGTIYRDMGEHQEALKYYNKSLSHAQKIKDWYTISWVNKDMSDLYLGKGDTSNAFLAYVLYKQYNDSLQAKKNITGLAEARIRYDADTHNKEIALLSLRLKNNRILTIGYTVLVFGIILIGILLFRSSKLNAQKKISEMNHRISEVTQANLRQQMNPHFIFNTLNSIQYYMYQHDKLATNNYLTKFSSLMRKVLDNSQHTSVPLRDELDALRLYLELECLRFSDKFEFSINVDEEIDPLMYKVPTMLIQPYVENSICHGLIPMEGKGFVKIDLKLKENYLICSIEDNGIGREAAHELRKKRQANHNSLGTRITTSRLELVNALYGTDLKTQYTDLKNDKGEAVGTRVEIHIPIMT